MNPVQKEIRIAELRNRAIESQKIIDERKEYQRQVEEARKNEL